MTPDHEELERRVHRALRVLPSPRAPHTLLPRVLAAAQTTSVGGQTSQTAHPWFTWSRPAQVTSLAACLLLAGSVAWLWPTLQTLLLHLIPDPVQSGAERMGTATETVADLMYVFRLVWQAVVAPVVKGLLAVTLILCAASALLAAALSRIALGGAPQS